MDPFFFDSVSHILCRRLSVKQSLSKHQSMAGELEKITVKGTEASKEPDFPGYVIGEKGAPGLVVLQVSIQ